MAGRERRHQRLQELALARARGTADKRMGTVRPQPEPDDAAAGTDTYGRLEEPDVQTPPLLEGLLALKPQHFEQAYPVRDPGFCSSGPRVAHTRQGKRGIERHVDRRLVGGKAPILLPQVRPDHAGFERTRVQVDQRPARTRQVLYATTQEDRVEPASWAIHHEL